MRPVSPPAHTGQTVPQSLPAFIADALRAAAFVPSDREALDIAGGVLATLAQLARAEAQHD